MIPKRAVAGHQVNPIGLGCMSLSHAYGFKPAEADAERLLHRALDIGYDFLDTAAIYGLGHNETLIGRALKSRRSEFTLASKCGFRVNPDGSRSPDGKRVNIEKTLDESLKLLGMDHIDLYYIHRPDPATPIEEAVEALADAVKAGKIGAIGLSEMSAETIRRAHAVHPIAALQTEYSLWTRNPEIAVLETCRELGITFVAFSPVGRGFLTSAFPDHKLAADDFRAVMPRFVEPNYSRNLEMLARFKAYAEGIGRTPAQLSLAWLLHRDPDLVVIPGTTSIAHLEENMGASDVRLTPAQMAELDAMINERTVAGPRYTPAMQATVTTEQFA
ncbi:MAG: aldo/keto reductase [Sphingomonadales bacterium]|nr:MAG: aldo/keto reductase [Sphingomonadales bacterium]